MAKGYGASAGMHMPAHLPAVHSKPKKARAPKKAMCKHCGQAVTPAPGSPMHQQQQSPVPALMAGQPQAPEAPQEEMQEMQGGGGY